MEFTSFPYSSKVGLSKI